MNLHAGAIRPDSDYVLRSLHPISSEGMEGLQRGSRWPNIGKVASAQLRGKMLAVGSWALGPFMVAKGLPCKVEKDISGDGNISDMNCSPPCNAAGLASSQSEHSFQPLRFPARPTWKHWSS